MDIEKAIGKEAAGYIESNLEKAPNQKATLWPLTFHLTSYSKEKKI